MAEIKAETIYINEQRVGIELQKFFRTTLKAFGNELNLLNEQFEAPFNSTFWLFAMIERTNVGVFNNAIIKSFEPKEIGVLQEYMIWENDKPKGRCDLIVKYKSENTFNLIFESKAWTHDTKNYSHLKMDAAHNLVIEQGKKYHLKSNPFYSGKTYVVSLIFEWVKIGARKILEKESDAWEENDPTDFYCFYHQEDSGLMVYGKLDEIKD